MKVSFKTRDGMVRFTAHKRKHKAPSHLKKYQFKAGSAKLATALKKARAALRRRR